jgi:hypothetical protein
VLDAVVSKLIAVIFCTKSQSESSRKTSSLCICPVPAGIFGIPKIFSTLCPETITPNRSLLVEFCSFDLLYHSSIFRPNVLSE